MGRAGLRLPILVVSVVIASLVPVATASATGPLGEVYVQRSKIVPSGSRRTLTVMCPNGRPILSGEVFVTGTDPSLEVASSGPVDGRDRDRARDDGWRGSINNDGSTAETMDVRAQCGPRRLRSHLRYLTETEDAVPSSSPSGPTLSCADGATAISGGSVVGGTTRDAPLTATVPADGSDGDALPGDGWRVQILNQSADPVHMVSTVICAHLAGVFTVATGFEEPLPSGQQKSTEVDCSTGSYAFGGGGTYTTSTVATIASTAMVQGPAHGSIGWEVWMNNPNASGADFYAGAICYDPP